MNRILLITNDTLFVKVLSPHLKKSDLQITILPTLNESLCYIEQGNFDAVLLYLTSAGEKCPPKMIKMIQDANGFIPIFFFKDIIEVHEAITLIKVGYENCYGRPFAFDSIIADIQKAIMDRPATEPKKNLSLQVSEYLKTDSEASIAMFRHIKTVADTNFTVVIYGETGTGKESVARHLSNGIYKDRPFVSVDCGCLSKELAASELFGHQKGSFTSADTDKVGAFEQAENGTLFLDEIGNLDYNVQILLLRAIQEKRIRRIGSNKEIDINVRIIVASNENLLEAVAAGKFREDLYYRLNEFEICIPPLRDRKDDIPLFIDHFIKCTNIELGKSIQGVCPELLDKMIRYEWPGNIRELKNVIRRSCLLNEEWISEHNLSDDFRHNLNFSMIQGSRQLPQLECIEENIENYKINSIKAELASIMKVLKQVKYNKTKAAEILCINRKTLYNKLRQYEHLLFTGDPKFSI